MTLKKEAKAYRNGFGIRLGIAILGYKDGGKDRCVGALSGISTCIGHPKP